MKGHSNELEGDRRKSDSISTYVIVVYICGVT